MAKFDDIFEANMAFLEEREKQLKRKVSAAERRLFELVLEDFLAKVEVEGGVIKSNGKNISLVNAIEEIWGEWNDEHHIRVVQAFANDLQKVLGNNERYFQEFLTNKSTFRRVKTKAEELMRARLGITKGGELQPNAFLDNFLKDITIKQEVRTLAINSVVGERTFVQLKEDMSVLINGNQQVSGQLQGYYRTFAYDTYQEFDRINGNIWAEEIGMDAGVYAGGKVNATRQFCCQRNGLIWTRTEMASWQNLQFAGKPPNYDPITMLGGFNCRHTIQWLSNVIAAGRRKDLKVEDGKLVPIKGVKKQQLNKCPAKKAA